MWKLYENGDFLDFAPRMISGQPPGAPDRFPVFRRGKKNDKKTVGDKENYKKTIKKENDKKTIKPFFFN